MRQDFFGVLKPLLHLRVVLFERKGYVYRAHFSFFVQVCNHLCLRAQLDLSFILEVDLNQFVA